MKAIPGSLWLAMTVWMEAQGEPDEGKLAVAHVIMNRARKRKKTVGFVCLEKLQFSCWNSDSPVRLRLPDIENEDPTWKACAEAAAGAVDGSKPDPTKGADHYLNEAVVKKAAGKLPSWFQPDRVTARIGNHTFLKLG
jgi:N-acetylmuramoyl-L-alanine amidase